MKPGGMRPGGGAIPGGGNPGGGPMKGGPIIGGGPGGREGTKCKVTTRLSFKNYLKIE